jgi:hypothetical protein
LDIRTEDTEGHIQFGNTSDVYFVEPEYEYEFKTVKQLLLSMDFVVTSAPGTLIQQFNQVEVGYKAYRPNFLREFLKSAVARELIKDRDPIEDSVFKNKENLENLSAFCMKDLSSTNNSPTVLV